MKRTPAFVLALALTSGAALHAQQLYPSAYELIYNLFSPDPNEGLTTFLSALIPMGGQAESMGTAFTAVASDASFLEINPAGSALLERTELALFHNNWILDTRIEGAVYAFRLGDLGLAFGGKWLYLPFTERDDMGFSVSGGYYSEAMAIGNVSYRFFPGYYFYGISVGASAKIAYRAFPDYTDDAGNVLEGSGGGQSAVTALVDLGMLTRFNLLKFYSSRSKNFSLGLAIKNLGLPVRDEPMPTVATLGVAYNFLKPILVTADLSVPVNLYDPARSEAPYWAVGYRMTITDFWGLRAGLLMKGANPRLSAGASLSFSPLTLDINYTLDLTTQFTPLNRMSIEARFDLGDMGRGERSARVDELYLLGMTAYASGDLVAAAGYWQQVLELDPHFDPAREGLLNVEEALKLQREILELQQLD